MLFDRGLWCVALLFILIHLGFAFFFFQAEDGIRDVAVTGVQTCALPIYFHVLELVDQVEVGAEDQVDVQFAAADFQAHDQLDRKSVV